MKIQRALISVSDKRNLVAFALRLQQMGIEIISTGGTANHLRDNGIAVTALSSISQFPEILDGRVKTLHPAIFGGILADRSKSNHLEQLHQHNIQPIDLVVVNLYPFENQAIAQNLDIDASVEWIDIGGPSLIRAAAKNHASVAVVTDPADYEQIADEMERGAMELSGGTRRKLAVKAFRFTSYYDAGIATYFSAVTEDRELPAFFPMNLKRESSLRYGENPHQKAALYISNTTPGTALTRAEKVQGKELSFNNLLDFDAALQLCAAVGPSCAVIIKHNNPCGVAVAGTVVEAYRNARATDPVSAFGGVVGINGAVDGKTAEAVAEAFIEGIVAQEFTADAMQVLSKKTGMRLLRLSGDWQIKDPFDLKRITGGALIQERDDAKLDRASCTTVTNREPTADEWKAMEFAWIVAQYVKSNAIVFTTGDRTVAVGAGQMSRVDSVKIARFKTQSPLHGTVVGSDAFFPFRDGLDEIAEAGATAVIQPGGSIRDQEVIDAANEHNIAMVFTGIRHFRH